ncbi:lipocalin family protein [Chitinophaga sp. CB10]|uniref:lipocalin family protein n=1 Tax=Chitinophaga sp. CB10 TaxID=1891659 RepID=UPI0025BBCC4D|nr:lipocalin family protein [Chitinophaga sp. CB10]
MAMRKNLLIGGAAAVAAAGVALYLKGRSVSIPRGATAVQPFDLAKYLGKWYEIARKDYRFEKNMSNVTATYSLTPKGEVRVDNRGFDEAAGEWRESAGRAKFVKDKSLGRFMVSFFPFIWAGYNVIEVDDDYQHALVVGDNLDYIWFLSRTPELPEPVRERFMMRAEELGYGLGSLIWTVHDRGL